MDSKKKTEEDVMRLDIIVVGAGAAGIGISVMLVELGVKSMLILEKGKVGASFNKWPKEMKLITPSFTTNFYGQIDLNSIAAGTSPAFSIRKEHPSGKEYAGYLQSIADYCGLPVIEKTNVKKVTHSDGIFQLHFDNQIIETRNLIWAAGEYQYPNTKVFPGSGFCLHNSKVRSWEKVKGDEFLIIGGYESGIDAAINLSRLGKRVVVLDSKARWQEKTTDPSLSLSPYTNERLLNELPKGNIVLKGNSEIKSIKKKDGVYEVWLYDREKPFTCPTRPILATGFKSSLTMISDLFDWHEEESYALINEHDESTKTPGLYLVGPQVRHENLIFCFIYKYRQRFGVVANAIGKKLDLDTSILEKYRNEGLYLDDLSCCSGECDC